MYIYIIYIWSFPSGSVVKHPPAVQEMGFDPWVGKIPWRRKWQPTPVFLLWTEEPGRLHTTGRKESDMTEQPNSSYNIDTSVTDLC